jgi:hypothetical protein
MLVQGSLTTLRCSNTCPNPRSQSKARVGERVLPVSPLSTPIPIPITASVPPTIPVILPVISRYLSRFPFLPPLLDLLTLFPLIPFSYRCSTSSSVRVPGFEPDVTGCNFVFLRFEFLAGGLVVVEDIADVPTWGRRSDRRVKG